MIKINLHIEEKDGTEFNLFIEHNFNVLTFGQALAKYGEEIMLAVMNDGSMYRFISKEDHND